MQHLNLRRALPSLALALPFALVAGPALANPGDEVAAEQEEAEPEIYGGIEAGTCAWPQTVAVTGGQGLCTGTLIHPSVVMYAAHCGGGRYGDTVSSWNPSMLDFGTGLA